MSEANKFLLPSPNFNKIAKAELRPKLHYLTPSGMSLLPRHKQPPPMYGPRGATLPAKYLDNSNEHTQQSNPQKQQWAQKTPELTYCEECDMELETPENLRKHRYEHVKCPVEGCKFRGHTSMMDNHVTALHTSGLYEKCKKLSTPEEIAAWREERKKRYPTMANVETQRLAKEQRQRRGERLEPHNTRFGNAHDRKRARATPAPHNKKSTNPQVAETGEALKTDAHAQKPKKFMARNANRKRKRNNKFVEQAQMENQSAEDAAKAQELMCGGFQMFRGTSQMKDYKHVNDTKVKSQQNTLTALLGMYGCSDSESESDMDEDANMQQLQEAETVENKEEAQATTRSNVVGQKQESQQTESREDEGVLKQKVVEQETANNIKTEEVSKPTLISNLVPTQTKQAETVHSILSKDSLPEAAANVSTESFNNRDAAMHNNTHRDSSDEAPNEAPIERSSNLPLAAAATTITTNSTPTIIETKSSAKKKPLTLAQKRKSGLNFTKARLRKQNTMLSKLLEPEIRHERNVLLQCVRFVCEQNFFGICSSAEKNTNKNNESL